MRFKTRDCPDANGRTPLPGEQKWTLRFPLPDGSDLFVEIGAVGRKALEDMIRQEEIDDRGGTYNVPGVEKHAN